MTVQFVDVSKNFQVRDVWTLKDRLLLGKRAPRHQVVRALSDISFTVHPGEAVAILGHNGSGKSTALKLLAQTIHPSSGQVRTVGKVAPLLELGAGFHDDLTGRENVFLNGAILGVRRTYLQKHLDEIVCFAELEQSIDLPIRLYSSGMRARLGFAIAAHVDPDIILVDELLAVGDASFQLRCLNRMNEFLREGRTLLLVTHSFDQAASICQRALVLNHGKLSFDGSISLAKEAYLGSTRAM